MKETTINQFIKKLITATGSTPEQLVTDIPNTSVWTFRKEGDTRIDIIKTIASILYQQKGLILNIVIDGQKIPFEDFNYKLFHLMNNKGLSVRQMAERMGISHNTLRSRLGRSSCTMSQLKQHFDALGIEMVFEINDVKYKISKI